MRHTLAAIASHEETIRKSRFLAWAGPVADTEAAMAFISSHSVPEATHNCWAYRAGSHYRFHDDGEPGGTAGRPILQAIEAQQCDQVAVLVVRWFGGIKLGTGGLVRAYGGVAAECLRRAPRKVLLEESFLQCRCPYPHVALVQSRLSALGARIGSETFDGQGAVWRLAVPEDRVDAFVLAFADLTSGQGECVPERDA